MSEPLKEMAQAYNPSWVILITREYFETHTVGSVSLKLTHKKQMIEKGKEGSQGLALMGSEDVGDDHTRFTTLIMLQEFL